MSNHLITIAIHQLEKATIAKRLLERNGIEVTLEEFVQKVPNSDSVSLGYHVKVKEEEANRAISLIGLSKKLSYEGSGVFKHDDGRMRILVAVDFSDYSLRACEAAFQVANILNAKVKILNVFANLHYPMNVPFANIVRGEESDGVLDKARRKMLALCQEIDDKISKGEMPSVNFSYSLREGLAEEEIEAFVDSYKPALLVIGTRGEGRNPKLIGNVAADIIEITNVPVLSVPLQGRVDKLTEIKHIGYLTNVDKKDLESFDRFVNNTLSLNNDMKITLIHINNSTKEKVFNEMQLLAMKNHFLEKYPQLNISYKVLESDNAIALVEEFVVKENVDILSLNTRKRNLLGRLFIPSMSRKLLKSINIHLLVLRD